MEVDRFQSAAEPVIKCERGRDQRPVRTVRRQRAERGGVGKEPGDVPQTAYIRILRDGVEVVEMEPVLKMVRVSRRDCQKNGNSGKPEFFDDAAAMNRAQVSLNLGNRARSRMRRVTSSMLRYWSFSRSR